MEIERQRAATLQAPEHEPEEWEGQRTEIESAGHRQPQGPGRRDGNGEFDQRTRRVVSPEIVACRAVDLNRGIGDAVQLRPGGENARVVGVALLMQYIQSPRRRAIQAEARSAIPDDRKPPEYAFHGVTEFLELARKAVRVQTPQRLMVKPVTGNLMAFVDDATDQSWMRADHFAEQKEGRARPGRAEEVKDRVRATVYHRFGN